MQQNKIEDDHPSGTCTYRTHLTAGADLQLDARWQTAALSRARTAANDGSRRGLTWRVSVRAAT